MNKTVVELVGGPGRPTYSEYLENAEAEEHVVQVLLEQGDAPWLLSKHKQRDDGPQCAETWCRRDWPCVWWERATEAKRRAEAEEPAES
ncbi:hypothetical protein GCM10023321_43610 [Pseudonocardia eucalypti]|uniref:Uncharacterized protein n=1 Tax=Pseudonocardia eucalypti TaxID=648755 RepID=A0ABP9QEH5_9PSEU|nr:hypothetical protein [Pseudonocardia eucalypti]